MTVTVAHLDRQDVDGQPVTALGPRAVEQLLFLILVLLAGFGRRLVGRSRVS